MRKALLPVFFLFPFLLSLAACSGGSEAGTYIGQLEAETVVVSAKASGELLHLSAREGEQVQKGQSMGQIDTESLQLQRQQQLARIDELELRKESARLQIQQAEVQLKHNKETLAKTEKLLSEGGATQQSRDDLATKVQVDQASLEILRVNYMLLLAQQEELRAGLELSDLAIRDASILSPVDGVILNRFHREGELVSKGTPLFELADLTSLDLYIYLPLRDLPKVKIGQEVQVIVSGVDDRYTGTVIWIASEGEFTPKTILTRETRDTLVYEVKILVGNPLGELKIGMPVDVVL
jgi:HlyD family secretion protein